MIWFADKKVYDPGTLCSCGRNHVRDNHEYCDVCERQIEEAQEVEDFYNSEEFQGGKQ